MKPIQDHAGLAFGRVDMPMQVESMIAANPTGWRLEPVVRRTYDVPVELVSWDLVAVPKTPAEGGVEPKVEVAE